MDATSGVDASAGREPGTAIQARLRHLRAPIAIVACAAVACLAALWPSAAGPLGWDEVDYVNASSLGVVPNALETGSIAASDYLTYAPAKLRGEPTALPATYDESRDPLVLRHYHPPLFAFLLTVTNGQSSERGVRSVQLCLALTFIVACAFAYRTVAKQPTNWGLATTVSGAVALASVLYNSLQMHGLFAITLVLVCTALTRCFADASSRSRWFLRLATAAMFLSLESAAVVVALAIAASLLARRAGSAIRPKMVLVDMATGALLAVIAWPGSLVRLSAAKIPAITLYRVLRGEDYASIATASDLAAPLVGFAVGASAVAYLLSRSTGASTSLRPRWVAFAVIGIGYTLALGRFAVSPTYVVPGVACLVPLVGLAVDELSRTVTAKLAIAVLAGLCIFQTSDVARRSGDQSFGSDVVEIHAASTGRRILADGGHILRYYLPDDDITTVYLSYDLQNVRYRRAGSYVPVPAADLTGSVLILQRRPGLDPSEVKLGQSKCVVSTLRTVFLLRC